MITPTTPSTPSSHHASASSFRLRGLSIVLLRPRQNTMRITFSNSYQCAIKSHFLQVPYASSMHCSSTLPRRDIKKPLSASALRIQNALFLTHPQRYTESHSPRVPSASRMHCSSRLRSVTPKVTLRECTRIQHALFSTPLRRHRKPLSVSALFIHDALLPVAALRRIALAYYKRTKYGHNVDLSLANRIWT